MCLLLGTTYFVHVLRTYSLRKLVDSAGFCGTGDSPNQLSIFLYFLCERGRG